LLVAVAQSDDLNAQWQLFLKDLQAVDKKFCHQQPAPDNFLSDGDRDAGAHSRF
jgi:hypothetical protein